MKKKFNLVAIFCAFIFAICGMSFVSTTQQNGQSVSANALPMLADLTIQGKSDVKEDDVFVEITSTKINQNTSNVTLSYTILGNDSNEFEVYLKNLKTRATSQSRIGKFVKIQVTSEDTEIQKELKSARAKVRLFIPTHLLSKKDYAVSVGTSPENFQFIAKDKVVKDEGYIVIDVNLGSPVYIGFFYDGAYAIVWICVGAFVVILGVAIFFKVRKMHKEDPEYYKQLKEEKSRKKQQNNKNYNQNLNKKNGTLNQSNNSKNKPKNKK